MARGDLHPEGHVCPDKKALLESIIAEHGSFVRARLRGLGVPVADLDDITQEVFWGVHRGLTAFDPALAPHPHTALRGWIFGICRKQAAHFRRARAACPESGCDGEALDGAESRCPDPEERLAAARRAALLSALVARLSATRRAVFIACAVDGLSISKAAIALSIPVGTVGTRLRAARLQLAAALRRLDIHQS